jgi:hypothetical protein
MLLPLLLKEQTRPKKVNLEKSFLFQSLALLFYSFTTFICKLFSFDSRTARAGLPDGIFSKQKSPFG